MKSALEDKAEKVVLIKGDKDAHYSAIMQAMDDLREAGIEDIGLITEKKEAKRRGGRQVAMAHAHNHFGAEKVVRGETPHASADMNVTPLIDVLLVLLIIFMAALPLTQQGVDINLPLETKAPTEAVENTQVMLEYTADRQISINHQPVTLPELESRLRDIFETRKEKTMFIAGDGDAALRRHHRGHRRGQRRRHREGRHRHRRHAQGRQRFEDRRQLAAPFSPRGLT